MQWLDEWVEHGLGPDELSERLTMAGLEIGQVTTVDRCDPAIVAGEILDVRPHPDGSKLSVCAVDVGGDAPMEIVCAAPNVAKGVKCAVAPPGSVVGGRQIEVAEIRGVKSGAMMCSEMELGTGEESEGIAILDQDVQAGASLNGHLGLGDTVFGIELTPNRADCFSVAGVAREVAILARKELRIGDPPPVPAVTDRIVPVTLETPDGCPSFSGRIVEGVRADARTPDWMRQKLHRSGLRCIHPLVDITNYVMMELGQPMHAYDLDIIDASGITVRRSRHGERMKLLDGGELDLVENSVLITDSAGPIGLGGVMGGASSAIRPETVNVYLEAAFFTPAAIRSAVASYGMDTDASHRFARGVDPTLQALAIERATALLLDMAGGSPGPTHQTSSAEHVPRPAACTVRESRVERVLGARIASDEIESILRRINAEVTKNGEGWSVEPPSYRFDLEQEHDQIEEIARVYGYNTVPSALVPVHGKPVRVSESLLPESSVRSALENSGYHEAITYSFVDPELQSAIKPSAPGKSLSNPISVKQSVMRTSLWPGLLEALRENQRRQQSHVRLYEIGRIFLADGERDALGGIAAGAYAPDQWAIEDRKIDFFDVKGDLARIFELMGAADSVTFEAQEIDGLHPGCGAAVMRDGERIGVVGELHPAVLSAAGVDGAAYAFEFFVQSIAKKSISNYDSVSRYPPVIRDIAVVVEEQVRAADLCDEARREAGDLLESVKVFDLYEGGDIDLKKKSIACRLVFRVKSRTLTDAEVDSVVSSIIKRLNARMGAQLR